MYIWSNISVYVISYFYLFDQTLSYDSAFYVDTIFKMLQIISSFFGIYLINILRLNPKYVVLFGGILASYFIYLSSCTTNFKYFMIQYGISIGVGTGIILMIPF